jgi:transposase
LRPDAERSASCLGVDYAEAGMLRLIKGLGLSWKKVRP